MRRRQHTIFTTVRSEGAILPADLLARVAMFDANLQGLTADSYYLLKTEKLNEAINRSWNRLLSAWGAFKAAREKLLEKDLGTTLTRERWLLPLFSELGYGRLLTAKAIEVNGKSYAISHGWQHTPMHLVSFRVDLDQYSRSAAGASGSARNSPHSLVQELLNRSEEHLWGVVSNGLRLRVLRNNASLTRQAYVEFDLEAMMNGEVYADFALLWLLCHQSRVEAERPAECWLEKWSRTALEQGTRALDQLRNGVEKAITALGGGFLAHPANGALREKLRSGALGQQDYYRQVLRLVDLAGSMMQLDNMRDDTVEDIHRKQKHYEQLVKSSGYEFGQLWADAWCAAFVWKKTGDFAYPITEEVFRNIERNPHNIASWMKAEIIRLREQYQFFHWHLAFPDVFRVPAKDEEPENEQAGWSGGFDVVLGNPPWERIKIQEKEWFATRRPDIASAANAAQRRRMIAALQYEDPAIYTAFMEDQRQATGESHIVRDSGRFPLCGRGDVNTYTIFAETMRLIINSRGRVGCIVPSGIATDDTTKFFFRDLMESHALVSLYDFDNLDGIFVDVDSRYKFCLLTLTGHANPAKEGAEFAFFLHSVGDLQEHERRIILSARDLALINPNTRTCPIFRSKRDLDITKSIYTRVPVLMKEGISEVNPWSISFIRMFDMTNDSHLFRTHKQLETDGWALEGNSFHKDGEVYLPLYEGKMIWHFDHRFGGYEVDVLDDSQHNNPLKLIMPRYWVHESHMPNFMRDERKALLGFRDITNTTNFRTSIISVLPVVPCGNNLPNLILDPRFSREVTWLASCTSSFAFDYVARQKLGGTHMNFFLLKQLPVLPPSQYAAACSWDKEVSLGDWIFPRALELTYTAWDLEPFAKDCGYDGPAFRWDEERRFLLRCELDAAYFHLYSIERDEVDYIMETFPIVKRKDEKEFGEYRTKRVILEVYDEVGRAMESGEKYETRLVPPAADAAVAHAAKERMDIIVRNTINSPWVD